MMIQEKIQKEKDTAISKMKREWETVDNLDGVAVIWDIKDNDAASKENVKFVKIKDIPAGERYALLPNVGYAYIKKLTRGGKCLYKNISSLRQEIKNIENSIKEDSLRKFSASFVDCLTSSESITVDGNRIFLEGVRIKGNTYNIFIMLNPDTGITWGIDDSVSFKGTIYLPKELKGEKANQRVFYRGNLYYGGAFETGLLYAYETDPDVANTNIWIGVLQDIVIQGINRYSTIKVIPKL